MMIAAPSGSLVATDTTTTPATPALPEGLTNLTTVNEAIDDRAEVANFAAYIVGSCYDDFDPRCQLAHDRVLADDAAYEFYRNQRQYYLTPRPGVLGIQLCVRPEDEVEPWKPAFVEALVEARDLLRREMELLAHDVPGDVAHSTMTAIAHALEHSLLRREMERDAAIAGEDDEAARKD